MTTRNIVPRNNNEGQLGTENKKWNKIYTNEIFATNFTGNLTGTADNAIKDNKSQQIDATYIKNISINNDTLTVTKGNDDSQDITINNISHAISSDNAINANKLQELTAGNSKGQIPINNGIENVNLNAALLNGKASSYFATSNHTHTTATQSSNGYMSNADKKKLDGIASGAEVNQNAFANVKVGSTTISSDAKQDTLELVAGTNISLVGDANNDKVTIGVTGKVASASQADNATKATQDSIGQTINTTYIKSVSANNATITATKGNGTTSSIIINNVAHATNADKATKATQDSDGKAINTTYIKKTSGTGENLTLANDNFGGQLTVKRNSGYAATIKYTNTNNVNSYIGFTGSDKTMYRWGDNGEGQTAFLDASNYNKYAPTKTGGGASGTWNISISGNAKTSSSTPILSSKGDISASSLPNTFSTGLTTHSAYNSSYPIQYGNVINVNNKGKSQLLLEWKGDDTAAGDPGHLYYRECRDNQNAWSNWKTIAFTSDNVASATKATKATQDSAGQTINTTYVKGVTANNATLTITKGNGSTSTTTVNNVSNATNANNLVISGGTPAHIKYGGGDVDENTAISQNKVNLLIGSWYSTGFRDLCSTGNPIRVAINHRNGNIKTTGNVTANGAMYSATPGTSDNSTRVATTAFVQSLINSLKGSIGGAIVASNLAQNGYVKFSNGLIIQWGTGTANKNGASYGGVSATLPIKINNMLLCVGNMSGSAACLMRVRFNAEKNTISGGRDSFQYNTPNPSSWRYLVIGI